MSPEIRINGRLILDAEDVSGVYPINEGDLRVYLDSLNPSNQVNEVYLNANFLKGREGSQTASGERVLQLNRQGTGSLILRKGETLTFQLKNPDLVRKPVRPRRRRSNRPWKAWV